jgi:type VI secretion system secreted protein Hcp
LAAVDYFLKIDGIAGESTDAKHKDEIQLEAFSWGLTNEGSAGAGAGKASGKVQLQDLSFTMKYNKASPTLMLACAKGQHIKVATLTARKAGKGQMDFLVYKFTDVLISAYHEGGAQDIPLDQISIAFGKVEVEYRTQKATGAAGPSVTGGWDFLKNKAL